MVAISHRVIPAVAAMIAAAGALTAQERRDTLVHVFGLTVPDSILLTYVEQFVSRADGSVFLLDEQTEGVLAFDPDGTFRRQIGRRGEGPGELLSPWRLGLLGQDTLWVVDARRRVNLYDASTGASLADFGPGAWDAAAGERFRPFAVLADHSVLAVKWGADDVCAEVRTHRFAGRRIDTGVSRAVLDVHDSIGGGSAVCRRWRTPIS